MKLGGIYVDVGAKTTGLKRGLAKAKSAVRETATSMKHDLKYVGIAAAAVGAAMVYVGKQAVDMASDMEETQGKFDVVFRGMTDTAEAWSKELVKSYAMSGVESKKFLSNIQDLIVPTGMAREAAGEMSNKFVQLAADLGSFNNLSTDQVIQDIQSALAGSAETMLKYGINVKQMEVRQEALNMGLVKGKEKLSAAAKVQAIYSIAMREGADAVGDMARTMGSYANQSKLLSANIVDLQTQVGQGLLPKMTELKTRFNEWLEVNGELMAQDIATFIEKVAENTWDAVAGIGKLIGWYNEFDAKMDAMGRKNTIVELYKEMAKEEKALDVLIRGNFFGMGKGTEEQIKKANDKLQQTIYLIRDLQEEDKNIRIDSGLEKYFRGLDLQMEKLEGIAKSKPIDQFHWFVGIAPEAEKAVTLTKEAIESRNRVNAQSAEFIKDTWLGVAEHHKKMLDKEVDDAVYAGQQMKDSWLSFEEGKADAAERANEKVDKSNQSLFDKIIEGSALTTESVSSAFGDFAADIIVYNKDLEESWEQTWKSMLATFVSTLADMSAKWAASEVWRGIKELDWGSGGSSGSKKKDTNWFEEGVDVVKDWFSWGKGGTPNAAGLSAYSNSVVSSPTIFPYASGATFGLMGEAGAEAILPLQRMANGDLGVATSGGGNKELIYRVEDLNEILEKNESSTEDNARGLEDNTTTVEESISVAEDNYNATIGNTKEIGGLKGYLSDLKSEISKFSGWQKAVSIGTTVFGGGIIGGLVTTGMAEVERQKTNKARNTWVEQESYTPPYNPDTGESGGYEGGTGKGTGQHDREAGEPGGRRYASGGIARGPESGYPATLHGAEAVVPLSGGRSIPVEMSGQNTIVNVFIGKEKLNTLIDKYVVKRDDRDMIGRATA